MGGVSWMLLGVGLIYTGAGDEMVEGCFIDSFVDVDSTFGALEIACGLSIVMLSVCWGCLLLLMQEVLDDLGPGVFFGQGFSLGRWRIASIFNEDLRAILLKPAFEDACGQALMHSCATRGALVPASVRLPPVMVFSPGFRTLLHQVTLVLFGLLTLMPWSLLVDVVQRVIVDLGQPLDCMLVDQLAIII